MAHCVQTYQAVVYHHRRSSCLIITAHLETSSNTITSNFINDITCQARRITWIPISNLSYTEYLCLATMTTDTTSPTRKMKIYLAGPEVFLPDPIAAGAALKELCTSHGAVGLFPMDNEIPAHILSPPPDSGPQPSLPAWIREKNMQMIAESDGIIANMTPFRGVSMDVGTAYEMGVARALGKVVIAYSSDRRSYVTKIVEAGIAGKKGPDGRRRDEKGMAVEEFEGCKLVDNLMMACGVDNVGEEVYATVDEAIKMAVKVWTTRQEMS